MPTQSQVALFATILSTCGMPMSVAVLDGARVGKSDGLLVYSRYTVYADVERIVLE